MRIELFLGNDELIRLPYNWRIIQTTHLITLLIGVYIPLIPGISFEIFWQDSYYELIFLQPALDLNLEHWHFHPGVLLVGLMY